MQDDNFDFDAFMKKALASGDTDNDLWREQMQQDVQDRITPVMHHLGPRMLGVIKRTAMQDPTNLAHQNAVMNAVIYTAATWLAACIPPGQEADENGNQIVDLVAEAVRNAMKMRNSQTIQEIGLLSDNGERMLLEDANSDIVRIMQAQVTALEEIGKRLDK